MRSALFAIVALAACGPKVNPNAPAFDEDLGKPAPAVEEVAAVERPVAPPGKGLRSGTIERARLVAMLDQGPPAFLKQLEVTAQMKNERFVGWQLVQVIDQTGPLHDLDLQPGDVLLAVNGKPISDPNQFQTLWDSLRTANQVDASLWRGDAKFDLQFTIEPAVQK